MDVTAAIAARENEKAALVSDRDLGVIGEERIVAIDAETSALKEKVAVLDAEWAVEKKIVEEIRSLREILDPVLPREKQVAIRCR